MVNRFFPETRPKVFLDTDEGRLDITESRLIANGSVGKVSYRINSNDFGTFAKLANVLMDEEGFIEYESKGGGGAGSEFGGGKEVVKEPARKEATQARKSKQEEKTEQPVAKKPVKASPATVEDDEDLDPPF